VDLLFGVPTLLVANEHDGAPIEARDAAHDGAIVGKGPIAVQLVEVVEDAADVVEQVGAQGVTRELRDLPGGQRREDRLRERSALLLQAVDLLLDVDFVVVANAPQLFDLRLELCDRLFEV
jgi:hypothetical protein